MALPFVGGCAPALPPAPIEQALVRDMARVVDVRQRTGWLVDESEIEASMPDALKSVCQVPERNRRFALAWLDRQIDIEGGDVAAAWRDRGRSLREVDDLLLWTRVRLLLGRADEWARLGRCPFWLEPTRKFRGVHIQGERFILTLEGGGRFLAEHAGDLNYGAGGSGRVLFGWAFNSKWALLAGPEFGGDARFEVRLGPDQQLPTLTGFAVFPVVLRYDFGLSLYAEVEAGPLAYINSAVVTDESDPSSIEADSVFGIRTGIAMGGSFLRLQQGVIPKFAFAFTVDVIPREDIVQLGFGARTGLDFSFWRRW